MADYEAEKEKAIEIFREILNTPDAKKIDFHFHAEVGHPFSIQYEIDRFCLP